MANSRPSDDLGEFADDFADEDSPEFRHVRAAIPTRPEIDALFADRESADDPPDGRAGRDASQPEAIFGASEPPLFRDGSAGAADRTMRNRGARARPGGRHRRTGTGIGRRVGGATRALVERLRGLQTPVWRHESPAESEPLTLLDRTEQEPADPLPETATAAMSPVSTPSLMEGAPVSPASPPELPPAEEAERAILFREAPQPGPLSQPPALRRFKLPVLRRTRRPRKRNAGPASWPLVLAATAVLSALAFVLVLKLGDLAATRSGAGADGGLLNVTTDPAGARVLVDGVEQGVTPARLPVPAGDHVLEVRTGDVSKTMPLTIAAGQTLSRAFDLKTRVRPATLDIRTSPAGAQVFVDGRHRGRSPLTLNDLSPGEHTVLVQRGTQSAEQVVAIEGGHTASVNMALAEAATATSGRSGGVLAIRAPVELDVYEEGRLLGTTRGGRIELPAGQRSLEFVNDAFGVRIQKSVNVTGGRATPLALEIPPGVVTINAIPWADVRMDGRLIGRTPIADLKVEAGRHDLVLRNPQHGQRRLTIMVNAGTPLVVTTDLRK